jgi:hypothetical protein
LLIVLPLCLKRFDHLLGGGSESRGLSSLKIVQHFPDLTSRSEIDIGSLAPHRVKKGLLIALCWPIGDLARIGIRGQPANQPALDNFLKGSVIALRLRSLLRNTIGNFSFVRRAKRKQAESSLWPPWLYSLLSIRQSASNRCRARPPVPASLRTFGSRGLGSSIFSAAFAARGIARTERR